MSNKAKSILQRDDAEYLSLLMNSNCLTLTLISVDNIYQESFGDIYDRIQRVNEHPQFNEAVFCMHRAAHSHRYVVDPTTIIPR